MYHVSEAFINAVNTGASTTVIGTATHKDGTVSVIDSTVVVSGTLYVSSQCVDGSDFNVGAVYANELGFTLRLQESTTTYEDAVIELRFGVAVDDTTIEYLPLGVYTVIEPTVTGNLLNVKAFDNMILLDESLDGVGTAGSLYALTMYCCERCGVTFGMTEQELELYPNGKSFYTLPSDSPVETCRDLISYIAQLLGCFACCDRSGSLVYRYFNTQPVATINSTPRTSTSASSYTVTHNGVMMPIGDNEYVRVNIEKPEGNTLTLESNPLLQNKRVEDIETALDNILGAIELVAYTPFECDYAGNPALDAGDFIRLTGGSLKQDIVSMISSSHWKYRGMQRIEGQGGNPKLKVKETQSQKRLNQTAAQAYGSKETVYFFENAAKRTIRTDDLSVIEIQFAAIKKASPMFHAAIVFKIETAGLLEFTYVIDNVPYPFKPMFNVVEGDITIPLFMPLNNMKENKLHTFEVYLKSADATGYIAKQQIQAVVVGQGLSAGEGMWDGKIRISEELLPIALDKAITIDFTATPAFVTQAESTNSITVPFAPIAFNTAITFGSFTETITAEHIVRNHLYTFNSATADSYTYSDRYYFADSAEGIKVATEYKFMGDTQPIDSGYLSVIQVDSARFDGVSKIKVEVE